MRKCCVPNCQLTIFGHGACRKHYGAIKELMALPPRISSKLPPLTTRVTAEAKEKLIEAGKGTLYKTPYQVASRVLERIPLEEVAKYLKD